MESIFNNCFLCSPLPQIFLTARSNESHANNNTRFCVQLLKKMSHNRERERQVVLEIFASCLGTVTTILFGLLLRIVACHCSCKQGTARSQFRIMLGLGVCGEIHFLVKVSFLSWFYVTKGLMKYANSE